MMTRAGTNKLRGTVNYPYWTNRFNCVDAAAGARRSTTARKGEFDQGRSHNLSLTPGGPVDDPGLFDGRGKLFYFGNYSYANDAIPGRFKGRSPFRPTRSICRATSPTCCCCRNPAQYQIYDPLTTRPDPANPSRDDPGSVPQQHHSAESHLQRGRQLQEPADGALPETGAAAEPELRRDRAAAERQFLSGRPARLAARASRSGFRLDFNASRRGSTVLPHQRRHVPRVRERLDLPEPRSEAAHEFRRPLAVSVVLHGHVDAHDGLDRPRHLVRHEPLQSGGQAPRSEAVHADRRRPAVVPRRVLLDARRLQRSPRSASAAIRGWAADCRMAIPRTHIQGQSSITSVKGRHTLHAGRRRAARPARPRPAAGTARGSSRSIAPTRGSSATRAR